MLLRDDYEATTLVDVPGRLAVGFAGSPHYPLTVERDAGVICALEGAAYSRNRDGVRADLLRLAAAFARDVPDARAQAEAWARSTDGDFVLCIADEAGSRTLIVNDRLGRLPLYYSRAAGAAAIAREIKFVRAALGPGDVDRQAIAQLLLFSFPLGERTLHRSILRLREASSVLLDGRGGIDIRSYYQWNFQSLAESASGRPPTADELASSFVEGCAAQGLWAAGRRLVVAMSGGLDSRSAAAGLSRAGMQYETVTFESGRRGASEESATAEAIAKTLGAPWRLYELARPPWASMAKLALRGDGTTNVGMAFMEEFFARVRSDFGADAVQVTGDGGDRALPDLADRVPSKGRDAFVERTLGSALWPVETVARLVRLDRGDVEEAVNDHFRAYPETGAQWWTVRYMIADWGWCRIFSGEDRNRSYLWTMSPFYCQSFFERAMRVAPRAKRDYSLYADFLRRLDPRVASIKKSNWGYAPTSPLVKLRGIASALQASAPAALKKAIGNVGSPQKRELNAARTQDAEFLAAIADRPNSVFDPAVLADVARRGCGKTQYHMLATALMYVDAVWREGTR
jgi:asparagine synthase (glutamine-hydrolysing)